MAPICILRSVKSSSCRVFPQSVRDAETSGQQLLSSFPPEVNLLLFVLFLPVIYISVSGQTDSSSFDSLGRCCL